MTLWIDVSVSKRQLKLYDASKLLKTYPIAVGKILTPTPTGNYIIINKEIDPGGPYGALWMGLSKPHYGIHGTNDPSSIGKEVSLGCIRMYNDDVIELSSMVPIQTNVYIHKWKFPSNSLYVTNYRRSVSRILIKLYLPIHYAN